ncbi:MAG TPA: hypothetical protein VMT52_10980 [Planctomycetota bacterium]|nr:hypothetical protein [Planctomycetota bacterium]
MRKLSAVLLGVVTLLVWCYCRGMFVDAQAGPGQPAADSRFCADSNGDGVLNIADAVTVLDYLFNGTATPYCIAQSQSLPFATRDETETLRADLQSLREQLKSVPRYYSGKYTGDGTNNRIITTGASGTIGILWIEWQKDSDPFHAAWISSEVDPKWRMSNGGDIVLDGPNFVVFGRARNGDGIGLYNERNDEYFWHALVTSE